MGERIRKLRERRSITQTQLADMLGMKTYTTITKWERDENFPKGKDIKRLSEIFNVSSDYILGIDHIPNVERVTKTISIPILGTIACGEPINAEENIEGYKERIIDDLPAGELFYLKAKGNSMTPVINSGSLVLCRRQQDVETERLSHCIMSDYIGINTKSKYCFRLNPIRFKIILRLFCEKKPAFWWVYFILKQIETF